MQFIGLNTRDLDKAPARKFVQEFGVGFPSIYDPSGKQLLGFRGQIVAGRDPEHAGDRQGRQGRRAGDRRPVTKQTLVGW